MSVSRPGNTSFMDTKYGGLTPGQWGAGGIAGGALAKNLFADKPDYTNPASAAMPYLDQIPDTLKPYYQPYIDRGTTAGNTLQGQYGDMTSNPSGFLNKLGQGYQQSPGYQWKLQQALQGSNNAAAAGGMLGTPAHQQENSEVQEGLANQDYESWLNHALNIFGMGQQGLEGQNNQGFSASTGYGSALADALTGKANVAQSGAAEQNKYNQAESNSDSSTWGDIAGLASTALQFL